MMVSRPEIEHRELPLLSNKSVLIVGGTHGVGAALAKKCIDLGAKVTVIGRTANAEIKCEQIIHDVVENPELIEWHYEDKDFVFNNIGEYYKGTIAGTGLHDLHSLLKTNIETMYILAQFSIRHAKEVVVNMSSRPTLEKYHSWGLYTLTKQAVITITQAAAEEGTQKHYAICPSRVDTKFRESVFPGEDKSTRLTPEQVADSILWLFNGKNPTGSAYWIKEESGLH